MAVEKTVVVVKPHVRRHFPDYGRVLEDILDVYTMGLKLKILAVRNVLFTQRQAEAFYSEHFGKTFYEKLIQAQLEGPCTVIILEGEDAIKAVRYIHGPTNPDDWREGHLRKRYGKPEEGGPYNALHATDSPEKYEREYLITLMTVV